MQYIFWIFVVSLIVGAAVAPPVEQKKKDEKKENAAEGPDELGLEYGRYLQQVVQALEEDKEFAKKLENISVEQIKSGQIAKELEFVKHNVRSKLDELKRIEVDRLRKLLQQQMERTELGLYRDEDGHLLNSPDGRRWRTIRNHRSGFEGLDRKNVKIPKHLDIENPHSFEIEDLKKLIQTATNDLEELDKQRREEFKKYELEKEAKYRESLKNMTEEERKETEKHHQELVEKHKDHPKVHHPGSKPQLEQVWEEQDHMAKEDFNPKTFFAMHDINGDGHLDVQEVEAILIPEVRKLYNPNNEEDDPAEMEEEFHRMREHIFNETDNNKDGLISLEEFLKMTEQQDFQRDEGWKDLDEQSIYTNAELEEYMRQRQMQMQYPPDLAAQYYNVQNAQQGVPPHINYQGMPPQHHYPQGQNLGPQAGYQQQYHPQQQQYQQGYNQQQQFQPGHPQQQQFQPGLPQQQQFQSGHPQQLQPGHPQEQQFQSGHPQQQIQPGHPQLQQFQPQQQQFQPGNLQQQQQFQSGHPQQQQQFQGVNPQQFQPGQQNQLPNQAQQVHLPNVQVAGANKIAENIHDAAKNPPEASNSLNKVPSNAKPNVPQEAAAQSPGLDKQVPLKSQS